MDEIMIKNIVREVLMKTNLDISCKSDQGVFEDVNDAIDAAYIAQRDWYMNYNPCCGKRKCPDVRKNDPRRDRYGTL